MSGYADFFRRITDNEVLPYQARYAEDPFSPRLMIVPTGLGKTDSVIVPWLYAQVNGQSDTPRRLIIILPRQNLTVQTAKNARKRIRAAGLEIRVLELLGGSGDNREDILPNEPAVIVCTQDLYFSRALNRGYARRPPRWPIDFALYNQDCLLVFDEIQLMDDALATSTQLAAFRGIFGTYGPAPCIWMSATVNPAWLKTVDFTTPPSVLELDDEDKRHPLVMKRRTASKRLALAPEKCREPNGCADFALEQHRSGTRTLVIANTVSRARSIFHAVREGFPNAVLLHSRFRPADRRQAANSLESIPAEGQIVVATQVLEAGVDITARAMVTDVAPWGSLVQRFGRVNRYGDDTGAEIWWVDRPATSNGKQKNPTAPYEEGEIARSIERITNLPSAALSDLPREDGPASWRNVLRRDDLLDLFDTTPDLSGNQLDVSRFIRDTEEKDVYIAWRDWPEEEETPGTLAKIEDDELCPVPIGEAAEFIRKKRSLCTWNFGRDAWVKADGDTLYPGMVLVARTTAGGYTAVEGWSPESKERVTELPHPDERDDEDSADPRSFQSYRQTLVAHTQKVREQLELLIQDAHLSDAHIEVLRLAASKHDWGKAHEVFQATLRKDDSQELLAKQVGRGRHARRHFRHELASAIAMLISGDSALSAYLVAAHHGKVRMGIRSMPGERSDALSPRARGIYEDDRLQACELAPDVSVPEVTLKLTVTEFGAEGGSWVERMLHVLDDLGPFRLAYLEMLLRAADERASNREVALA